VNFLPIRVQRKELHMYKKILVPLDGSPLSEAVLPHAEALAKSEHAELIILRIPAEPASRFLAQDPLVAEIIRNDLTAEAEKYVHDMVATLQKDEVQVSGLTRDGLVPDMILKVADETHADIIAMSTHGRTGVSRWLLGSVAEKIVHHAHIPVMLVHPN
jgi:nucleotide-binding universal stress UspA family protein